MLLLFRIIRLEAFNQVAISLQSATLPKKTPLQVFCCNIYRIYQNTYRGVLELSRIFMMELFLQKYLKPLRIFANDLHHRCSTGFKIRFLYVLQSKCERLLLFLFPIFFCFIKSYMQSLFLFSYFLEKAMGFLKKDGPLER